VKLLKIDTILNVWVATVLVGMKILS